MKSQHTLRGDLMKFSKLRGDDGSFGAGSQLEVVTLLIDCGGEGSHVLVFDWLICVIFGTRD